MCKFTLILLLCAGAGSATVVQQEFNQTAWQQGITTSVPAAVTPISLANWQPGVLVTSNNSTNLLSSTTGANGLLVTVESGFANPGYANPATLGQITNGVFADNISKYGYTIWTFSQPIYAFSANFDMLGGDGLFFAPGNIDTFSTASTLNGFFGFDSTDGFTQLLITWSDLSGNPGYGSAYNMTNLEVATVNTATAADIVTATPEPTYIPLFALGSLLAIAVCRSKRPRARS
jgi:hypothetical protein